MSRPHSLCFYCNSVSRPQKYVATSFLLSSFLLLGHSFSFMLQHHLVVLSFQAGRDSKLLICLFSCRNMDIRSQPSIFFNHCNSCHDLKSMPRPSLLPIQSQPHFLVSTVPLQFSISSRNLDLMSQHEFLLPAMLIFVATMFF